MLLRDVRLAIQSIDLRHFSDLRTLEKAGIVTSALLSDARHRRLCTDSAPVEQQDELIQMYGALILRLAVRALRNFWACMLQYPRRFALLVVSPEEHAECWQYLQTLDRAFPAARAETHAV